MVGRCIPYSEIVSFSEDMLVFWGCKECIFLLFFEPGREWGKMFVGCCWCPGIVYLFMDTIILPIQFVNQGFLYEFPWLGVSWQRWPLTCGDVSPSNCLQLHTVEKFVRREWTEKNYEVHFFGDFVNKTGVLMRFFWSLF